jgi:hypothetical protein
MRLTALQSFWRQFYEFVSMTLLRAKGRVSGSGWKGYLRLALAI